MNNILLILQREFFTRVKSRSFLLTTFLAPLGVVLIYAVLIFLLTRGSDTEKVLAVVDHAGITDKEETKRNNLVLDYSKNDLNSAIQAYLDGEIDGVVELPGIETHSNSYDIIFHSDEQLAIDETETLKGFFRKKIRNFKITALGIDQSQLDLIDTDLSLSPKIVKDTEKEISSLTSVVSSGIGGIVGFILFMMAMIYGNQVMRSVTEEKISRIVEVLISSVKPFQLMMGKILGVGLVGLTQISIWTVLMIIITLVGSAVTGFSALDLGADPETLREMMASEEVKIPEEALGIVKELAQINWAFIIPMYIFFFLIGFLTYAALYAAIGSAVGDDLQDAQTLTTIATLPMVAAFYIAIAAVSAPNSSLSIWSSILPFSGPIVMPVRLATSPPMWQVIASVLSSIASVILFAWLAGRIYRVGILMYGKKASFRELGKWIFFKG